MRELHTRFVDRAAGITVSLYVEDEGFTVQTERANKQDATVYVGSDYAEAQDAFLHPFAKKGVQSPWDETDEQDAAVKYEDAAVPV